MAHRYREDVSNGASTSNDGHFRRCQSYTSTGQPTETYWLDRWYDYYQSLFCNPDTGDDHSFPVYGVWCLQNKWRAFCNADHVFPRTANYGKHERTAQKLPIRALDAQHGNCCGLRHDLIGVTEFAGRL